MSNSDPATPAFVGGNTGLNNGLYAVGAAVAPSRLGLSTPRPPDFDTFWDAKLSAQAKVSINPSVTPIQSNIPGIEENIFTLDAMGSKVHGYVAKPARKGQFPAIIQLQYAGIYALDPNWAAQLASDGWLVINVDAHDKLPSDSSGHIPKSYVAVGNADREKSYFLNRFQNIASPETNTYGSQPTMLFKLTGTREITRGPVADQLQEETPPA